MIFSALPISPVIEDMQSKSFVPASDDRMSEDDVRPACRSSEAGRCRRLRKCAFGPAWEALCRQVHDEQYDLEIVGTRDFSRVGRLFSESTGLKLLRHCSCPVWIARPDLNEEHQEILVPSDFSEVSSEALRLVFEGQDLVSSRLHVIHVLQGPVGPPPWYGRVSNQAVAEYIAEQRAQVQKKLHEQLADAGLRRRMHGIQVHVVEGSPDEEILKAINELNIELVVMGTSARSGVAGLVLGNTAERIVSHIKCSLIAVKPAAFHGREREVTEKSARPSVSSV